MATYTIQRGDNLPTIARRHGFRSWQEIYNHPSNAGFKRLRANPNLIYPGDIVNIPAASAGGGSSRYADPPPGGVPARPDPRIDDKCCMLVANVECPYIDDKWNYTCKTEKGYVQQSWFCVSGERTYGCGECMIAASPNCKSGRPTDSDCSIWWDDTARWQQWQRRWKR